MQTVLNLGLTPNETLSVSSSDTAAAVPNAITASSVVPLVQLLMITVEGAAIRYALKATPIAGSFGDRLEVGEQLLLDSAAQVKAFRFVSADSGVASTVYFYPEG